MINLELIDEKRLFDDSAELSRSFFSKITAPLRVMPEAFIIGAQKAGTTSLYQTLQHYPSVLPAKRKEHYFFHNEAHFKRGINWYKSGFASRWYAHSEYKKVKSSCFSIDATANYFEFPETAARIKSVIPQAKIIVLLRNPVHRAYSHYRMSVKLGFEKADFYTALLQEMDRIQWGEKKGGHNFAYQRLGYASKGKYAFLLKDWINHFGSQLLIVCSEELFLSPGEIMEKITRHLGISYIKEIKFEHENAGTESEIPDQAKDFLQRFFLEHNQELRQLLNRDFPW